MKYFVLIIVFLGFVEFCSAQDQLFKKDNSKILVKITEISPEEIKYKLFNNLNGPTYVISKSEVSMLIYENGQHEVINSSSAGSQPSQMVTPSGTYIRPVYAMSKKDSLTYYKYSESVSLNFFNFLNSEIGLIYQKDFFKSNFNIIIPVAIGIEKPTVTQSVYFNTYNNSFGRSLNLNRKLFEVGFGVNYYPSLRFPVNYYVGPVVRYMQYSSQQTHYYRDASNFTKTIVKNNTISRYCISITNGIIFRTRSRLSVNLFGSLGFKNDIVNSKIVDPVTNKEVDPISNEFNLYFWTGFAVGFGF